MFQQTFVVFIVFTISFSSAVLPLPTCENTNAMYNVSAIVYLKSTSKEGRRTQDTNFYQLDDNAVIDVLQANVPDVCEEMILDMPVLEKLTLINVNINRLQRNAFKNCPKLVHLSLAVNNLKKIIRGSFNNLPSLKVLYLSSNQISYIEERTFADMPHLQAVHLDRNKLTDVNGNLFMGSPNMAVLDMKFNLIQKITATSFEDFFQKETPITIKLNKNLIDEFDANFDGMSELKLHLEGNRLDRISGWFQKLPQNTELYLNQNRIACVPDDVIDEISVSRKYLYLFDNPIDCQCVSRLDKALDNDDYGTSDRIFYNSTFPCEFALNF